MNAVAEDWIRSHVDVDGPIEIAHERPWAAVLRVPLRGGGAAWFKACGPVRAFEPRLTAALASRRPDLVPEVLAWDGERAWLLLGDAGYPVGFDSPIDPWLELLPRYAELQIGEAAHAGEHLADGVPDLRLETLAERYEDLLARDLPVEARVPSSRVAHLCAELAARGIPASIQHDDLHGGNVYGRRILDWGDSSVSHPFFSVVATLHNHDFDAKLLRDAYLEPWDADVETFELAVRVGRLAYAVAWLRQYDNLPDDAARAAFSVEFANVLRLAYSAAA